LLKDGLPGPALGIRSRDEWAHRKFGEGDGRDQAKVRQLLDVLHVP
jgi:hypothetical protein